MVSFLRALGVIVGLVLFAIGALILAFSLATDPRMTQPGTVLGTISVTIGAVVGVLIVRWASPGFLARVGALFGAGVRALLKPSAFVHPVGMAIWTLLVAAVLLAVPVAPRFLIVLFGFIAYLVVAMGVLLFYEGWWLRALLTLLAGPVVVMGLIAIAEAFEPRVVGEGALALLGPLMFSWGVLPVMGLIRFFVRAMTMPTPPSTPPSDDVAPPQQDVRSES